MPDLPAYPGMPRWVKMCSLVGLFLVALFVGVHLYAGDFAHLIDHGRSHAP